MKIMNNSRRLSDEQVEEIILEYKSRPRVMPLSKKYNIADSSIKKVLQDNGVSTVTREQWIKEISASTEEIEKIKELYKTKTPIEISKLMGLKVGRISSVLRKEGIPPKYNTNNWQDYLRNNKQKVIDLYEELGCCNHVAERLEGPSGQQVAQFFDEIGYSYKKNKKKVFNAIPSEDKQKVHDLHHKEMKTMKQIGKLYNVTGPTVAVFFDENNIPRRSKSEAIRVGNQDNELAKKRLRGHWQKKDYVLPSGKQIKLLGYEPQFLDYIFENKLLMEEDIDHSPNRIKYFYKGKQHYYFPDFYIKSKNTIVEIKSTYILKKQGKDRVTTKEKATREAGYNYLLVLDNNFEELNNLLS